uniref:Uncharacterized protein n=1 Tax=Trieres chinensis TaxID=1514140 RepID=A0A7S2EL07_TRICV
MIWAHLCHDRRSTASSSNLQRPLHHLIRNCMRRCGLIIVHICCAGTVKDERSTLVEGLFCFWRDVGSILPLAEDFKQLLGAVTPKKSVPKCKRCRRAEEGCLQTPVQVKVIIQSIFWIRKHEVLPLFNA